MKEKTLHIVRGHSGSGKSTLAKTLTPHVFEADDYFIKNGVYKFNPLQLEHAHTQCRRSVAIAMKNGISPIAVANTFTMFWEFAPYKALASKMGYKVQVHICTGNYPNVHGVPANVVEGQKIRFQV